MVELIPLKWTFGIVSGVFALAVNTFERVGAQFTCFCFESGGVCFEVCFAAPC